jgi:Tol biopolymer transport system component/DNA-binding winged helix-turn-helix (wHTH) protein
VKSFEVGEWRVHPSLNRLTRGAEEVRVEPKVMQVLETLAATPGDVVTREDLVAKVWPGVFVSDDVVHRAIRELRRVFNDDSANPAYVETIRKRGYRLIAPVTLDESAIQSVAPPSVPAALQQRAGVSRLLAAAAITVVAVVVAVAWVLASRSSAGETTAPPVRFVAWTSGPLNEVDPSISPDGAGSDPTRMTSHPADDRYPAWNADASRLAFIRLDGGSCHIMLMRLDDRSERRLSACGNTEEPRVSWSADGAWLIESFSPGPDPIRGWQIARVSTSTGVREPLTLPHPGTLGDHSPAVSPDGTRIAFARGINGATADVHITSIAGGAVTRLTWDNQDLVGLDWSADGRSIVFATDRAGGYTIWRAALDGGDPELVVGGAAKLKHPSIARATGRLTYESWSYEINLWDAPIVDRLDIEGDVESSLRPVVQTSDQWNHSPDLSPDGQRLAFVSTRSGHAEVWLADRKGAGARQLSSFGRAALRAPRWSPDGKSILISAAVNGRPDLYSLDASSGQTVRITDDDDDEIAPAWSHDGQSLMFGARIGGTWQLVRMDRRDRTRRQLTSDGGYAAQPSPDGTRIRFTRLERPGVWEIGLDGGTATLVVPNVRAAETVNWRTTPEGTYYVGMTGEEVVVKLAPAGGGSAVDVAWIGNYSWPGFAVAPDGRVIYAHWDRRDANIMSMGR